MLLIVDHFNVTLNFNSGAVNRIYHSDKISAKAFLAIIGARVSKRTPSPNTISIKTLINCLHGSRSCFLSFQLPNVHHGLVRTVSYDHGSITFTVLHFFSRCITRIRGRVSCRRRGIFPCIRTLLTKRHPRKCSVSIFHHRRSRIRTGLTRLGHVVVHCCPSKDAGRLGNILFSVFAYRHSLTSRGSVRSHLFVPTVGQLRRTKRAPSSIQSKRKTQGQSSNTGKNIQ